jgi:hypothetical protein
MLRPKTIAAITILAVISGAFYVWQAARDVPPTRSIITGVKDKPAENSGLDTEEEARLKRAIALLNQLPIGWDDPLPEGYESVETCGPSLTGIEDAPPFCYQIIKRNHTPMADDALPALDCKEGDIFNTCLIEQRLAYFKPDYIQNRADIHAFERFVTIVAPYASAKQIQRIMDIIASLEKSHANIIIAPDLALAKLMLYLAQGSVDPAVEMLTVIQESGSAFETPPQIGAAYTLVEHGHTESAREFIVKTQHIKFPYPKSAGIAERVEYAPVSVILKQLLLAGKVQDTINFIKQINTDNVYMSLQGMGLCHHDIVRYAYKCSPQLKKQVQHCSTERFEDLPAVPGSCTPIDIPIPAPEKFYKSTPPPAQDPACLARYVQYGYAHSPALLPMACMDKLLWGAAIWGRKHQIEAAFQKLLVPQP